MAPVSPMACIDSRRFRQDADDPGIALSALIGVERGWAGPDRNFTAKNHRNQSVKRTPLQRVGVLLSEYLHNFGSGFHDFAPGNYFSKIGVSILQRIVEFAQFGYTLA